MKGKEFKKSSSWVKFIIVFVLFGVTLVFIAGSPLFNVTQIEIKGNTYYNTDAIIDLIDISVGENGFKYMASDLSSMLGFRFTNMEEKIKSNCPYIKEIKAKFLPPSKVLVEVEERNPMGIIPYLGTSLLMDEEGYIVDTVNNEEEYDLPVIKGIRFEFFELGQKPYVESPESIKKATKVINIIDNTDTGSEFKLYNLIDSIDVSSHEVYLFIDSRLIVNLGGLQDLRYRINVLRHIYSKNLKKDDRGLLDFTVSGDPIFIPEK